MSVRLEPIYLANVLLHLKGVDAIKAFPFISKDCREATFSLKVNPAALSESPREILKLFPNINTMVVPTLSAFKETDILPETVTVIVFKG